MFHQDGGTCQEVWNHDLPHTPNGTGRGLHVPHTPPLHVGLAGGQSVFNWHSTQPLPTQNGVVPPQSPFKTHRTHLFEMHFGAPVGQSPSPTQATQVPNEDTDAPRQRGIDHADGQSASLRHL